MCRVTGDLDYRCDLDRIARTYAAAADHYDAPALGFRRRYGRQTVARLGLRPGDRVFDAYCRSGESALAAAEAVAASFCGSSSARIRA
jgi:ubiquinone/menaquinone biosynthesis C-methylase UbiE